MTECQGCGAWNDASRILCVLCGTPLAETDEWDAAAELPPLPPLPDGGLRASMPTWLRDPPVATPSPPPRADQAPVLSSAETAAPLGPRADPRTFLSDDDFPRWLRDLAARRAEVERSPVEMAAVVATAARPDPPLVMPPTPADTPVPVAPEKSPIIDAAPSPAPERLPPAEVAARAPEDRRGREPWETLLLAALFIGVVVAALWALVANGVLGPGL